MGNRIPLPVSLPPVPAGDPATICWGPGKDFGDKETPIQFVLRVSGVVKGPGYIPPFGEAQNGQFLLSQSPTIPNLWQDSFTVPVVFVNFLTTFTAIRCLSTGGIFFFSYSAPPICSTFISNQLVSFFTGGTVRLWLLEVQA